jgi:copper chaperone CopZ
MTTYELAIEGMGCPNCVQTVEKALREAGFKVLACDTGSAKIASGMNADALKKTLDDILQDVGYMLVSLKAV